MGREGAAVRAAVPFVSPPSRARRRGARYFDLATRAGSTRLVLDHRLERGAGPPPASSRAPILSPPGPRSDPTSTGFAKPTLAEQPLNSVAEIRERLPLIELLDRNGNVSQRWIAERMGIALTRVNRLIRDLVREGMLKVEDEDARPFAYRLTPSGRTYRRQLKHTHDHSVVGSFRQVQRRIHRSLADVAGEGVRRVAFYGAGEIMEVAYPLATEVGLHVVTVVDDDPARHGRRTDGVLVEAPVHLRSQVPDAIVITSFRHAEEILRRIEADGEARIVEL